MDMNYAEEFIKLEKSGKAESMTVDDFCDHCKIPKELRSDFLMSCVMNQVSKIKTGKGIPFESTEFARSIDNALVGVWKNMTKVAKKITKHKPKFVKKGTK